MSDPLEATAARIMKRVNDRIQSEGRTWSPYEYAARAEMVAREEIPDAWEWMIAEHIGALPAIVLMRYDPRRV